MNGRLRYLSLALIIVLPVIVTAAQASDWGYYVEAEGTPLEKRVALVKSTESVGPLTLEKTAILAFIAEPERFVFVTHKVNEGEDCRYSDFRLAIDKREFHIDPDRIESGAYILTTVGRSLRDMKVAVAGGSRLFISATERCDGFLGRFGGRVLYPSFEFSLSGSAAAIKFVEGGTS